jgi:hypothetical protein
MTPETNTYAFIVRDAILQRLEGLPFFSNGWTFATTTEFQIQPENIPFCGVYFVSENATPDGDANTGEVRHRVVVRIGISVIVQSHEPEHAELELDKATLAIMGKLFADPTLYHSKDALIQAFPTYERTHQFGNAGSENELPIAELRLHINCDLGTVMWPPTVNDYLRVIHVKTAFPIGGDTEAVQQVEVEYDILQGEAAFVGRMFRGLGSLKVDASVTSY